MALTDGLKTKLGAIADAIREKNGKTDNLTLPQMATEISMLGGDGLDFEGIYDKTQADKINQYYKAGIDKAKQIILENPNSSDTWYEKFANNLELIFLPPLDLSEVTTMARCCVGCQNLVAIPYISVPEAKSLQNAFSFCVNLKGIVRINAPLVETLGQCFYNGINISEIHLTSIAKCNNFTNTFFCSIYGTTPQVRVVHFEDWGKLDISLSSYSLLSAESIHYIIQNAVDLADGATARTLTLHATAKTNWENSEYYEEDEVTRISKGITIA